MVVARKVLCISQVPKQWDAQFKKVLVFLKFLKFLNIWRDPRPSRGAARSLQIFRNFRNFRKQQHFFKLWVPMCGDFRNPQHCPGDGQVPRLTGHPPDYCIRLLAVAYDCLRLHTTLYYYLLLPTTTCGHLLLHSIPYY